MEEQQIPFLFPLERFDEPDVDQSNGFYDFLRTQEGTIIGIRWFPFPSAEHLLDDVRSSPLINVAGSSGSRILTIWFTKREEFEDDLSCDQYFYWNRVFVSRTAHEIGITFTMDGLSPEEIKSIEEGLPLWA